MFLCIKEHDYLINYPYLPIMRKIKNLFLLACSLFCLSSVMLAQNAKPFVIPELKEWKGGDGQFVPTASSRIVCASGEAELLRVAQAFAADYEEMFGVRMPVMVGKAAAGEDILYLLLGEIQEHRVIAVEGRAVAAQIVLQEEKALAACIGEIEKGGVSVLGDIGQGFDAVIFHPVKIKMVASAAQSVGIVKELVLQKLEAAALIRDISFVMAALLHLHRIGTEQEHSAAAQRLDKLFLILL